MTFDSKQGGADEQLASGTPFVMFLAWAIGRGLADCPVSVTSELGSNLVTALALTSQYGSEFRDSDLSEAGRAFSASYYSSGQYFADFAVTLGEPTSVRVDDGTLGRLTRVLDQRYLAFSEGHVFWERGVTRSGRRPDREGPSQSPDTQQGTAQIAHVGRRQ